MPAITHVLLCCLYPVHAHNALRPALIDLRIIKPSQRNLTATLFLYSAQTMIELVLGTDMKQHVCLTTQFASLHRIDTSAAVKAAAAALEPPTSPRLANLHPIHRQAHRHTRGPGNNVLRAWSSRLGSLRRTGDLTSTESPAISSMTGGVKGLMLRALVSLDYRRTADRDGRVPAVTRPATIDIGPEAEARPQPGSKPQPNGHTPSSEDFHSPPGQLRTGSTLAPFSLGAAPERGQLSPTALLGGIVRSQLGVQGQSHVPHTSGNCTTPEGTTGTRNTLACAKTFSTSQLHVDIASTQNTSEKAGHGRAKPMSLPTLLDVHAYRGASKGGNCPPVSAADTVPLMSGVGVAVKGAHRLPMVELQMDAKSDEPGSPKAKPGAAFNVPPAPVPQPAEQTEEATRLLMMQVGPAPCMAPLRVGCTGGASWRPPQSTMHLTTPRPYRLATMHMLPLVIMTWSLLLPCLAALMTPCD